MAETKASPRPRRLAGIGLPPPDTPGGLAVLGAVVLGIAYVLVMVGVFSALEAELVWVITLNLILGVVVTFFLVVLLGSDRARATQFELEFARTVEAHRAAGETLVEASPLGGILSEYARAADAQRRAAREHAYAAGPALYSTVCATFGALVIGLASATQTPVGLVVVAMLAELFALVLLGCSAGALALGVGRDAEVLGFHALVPRRWSTVAKPSFPFTHALTEVPWAVEAAHLPKPAPWKETAVPVLGSP